LHRTFIIFSYSWW